MRYIGLDPGKGGGVAVVPDLSIWRTPIDDEKNYDIQAMKRVLIAAADGQPSFVVIERAQSFPRFKAGKNKNQKEDVCPTCKRPPTEGSVSLFGYGEGYGIWKGLLVGLGYVEDKTFITVHPRVWTRMMNSGAPGEGKDRNIWVAKKRFPQWMPRNKGEELALCDAILLAEYGRLIQSREVFSKPNELDFESTEAPWPM